MKKIEVPSHAIILGEFNKNPAPDSQFDCFEWGVGFAIAYANEQIEQAPEDYDVEAEQDRWQDAILRVCDESGFHYRPGGSDTSDPLDYALDAIRGCLTDAKDQIDEKANAVKSDGMFLSDREIDEMFGTDACRQGAKWARDKYEGRFGSPVEETWSPTLDALVIGWGHRFYTGEPVVGRYVGKSIGGYHEIEGINIDLNGWIYRNNVALIESIDEIGNEPQYFIERGRCTVRKESK